MRGAQPAEADRRARIVRADEHHFLAGRIEHAQHQKQIGVGRVGRHEQFRRHRPGDFHGLRQRRREEGDAVARRLIGERGFALRRLRAQAAIRRMQEKFRPLRARERPFVLGARHEFLARMADVEQHLRLLVPAGVLALEEMREEAALQVLPVFGVEQGEVRIAVHLQPFLFRAGAQIALEIAARMQPHAAPVRRRQQRRFDILEFRQARLVIVVDQAMLQRVLVACGAIFFQFVFRQCRRPRDRLAGHGAPVSALADAVLHGGHLARIPAREEIAEDAAVAAKLAVIIRRALPDAQRRKMLRPQRRRLPLVHRVVRDAVDADLAVRPRLHARPFDARGNVLRLARRPHFQIARRAPGAARVDAQADIAVRHPFLRVEQLPVLVLVAGAFEHVRRRRDDAQPRALVGLLHGEALGVRPIAQDHRIFAVRDRPEHIGAQHDAVVHRDRRIPVDRHAVADFGFVDVGAHGRDANIRAYSPQRDGWQIITFVIIREGG